MTLAAAVIEKWTSQGVVRDDVEEIADGRALAALDALEAQRQVELPASFRELWTRSDGTGAMDDDEFLFWPLDNIMGDPSLGSVTPPTRELVFADWRLTSRVFLLAFEAGRPGAVFSVVDGTGPERVEVAGSFDAFLERYLVAPRALIVRAPRS